MIRVGSAFSGIGGFELGVEESWDHLGVETVWQIEKDSFCQQVLKKHWPNATLHEDITTIEPSSLEPVDVIIGGFPCQDISIAGKQKGVNEGEKSGLWWKLWNIIGELRPRIIILENVSNIVRVGGSEVLGSLSEIGYDSEWQIIRASDFGAPHRRARWFCVCWDTRTIQTRSGLLPTPTASEHKYRLKGNSQQSNCLEARARKTGKGFQLNPRFVEEMMGFPIGFTELDH